MAGKSGNGGKNRRRGKNGAFNEKRELLLKEDEQEYAQVLRMLGNGRIECLCVDGVKRLCHIRGRMRKKVWINIGDIVLVSLRDFQAEKADVIHKYNNDEVRALCQMREIPESLRLVEAGVGVENDAADGIAFESDASDQFIDIAAL